MMAGKFREYNWRDIQRLIYADAGLTTEEEQRTRGQMWYCGGFAAPEHERDTCIKVNVYEKPFSVRIEEHAG
jgi:hypothetical protein